MFGFVHAKDGKGEKKLGFRLRNDFDSGTDGDNVVKLNRVGIS